VACFAKALSQDDEDALTPIDQAYAEQYGVEPLIQRSSLSFFERSGHAFTALNMGEVVGYVFAQAIFNGTRPTVLVSRLTVQDSDVAEQARAVLVEAVTKSAYDAAVYDLLVLLPEADSAAQQAFAQNQYDESRLTALVRTLGSRGQNT
jgi:hypothetical protein